MAETVSVLFLSAGAVGYGLLAWRAAVGWDLALFWRSLLAGGVGVPLVVRGAAAVFGLSVLPWPAFVPAWLAAGGSPWAGAAEEAGKALVLGAVFWRERRRLADAFDGALCGVFAGAGYGLWTLWALVRHAPPAPGGAGVLLHLLAGWTFHAVTGAASGALLVWSRQLWQHKRVLLSAGALLGLGLPAAAQASYLALVAATRQPGAWLPAAAGVLLLLESTGVAVLAGLYGWRARRERALWGFLREEVATGLVSEEEFYTLVANGRGLPAAVRQALLGLAAAKWRVARGVAGPVEVERWRRRVSAARHR
ncbi:MAG: hypothetical protein ACK45F_08480 [bacterium]